MSSNPAVKLRRGSMLLCVPNHEFTTAQKWSNVRCPLNFGICGHRFSSSAGCNRWGCTHCVRQSKQCHAGGTAKNASCDGHHQCHKLLTANPSSPERHWTSLNNMFRNVSICFTYVSHMFRICFTRYACSFHFVESLTCCIIRISMALGFKTLVEEFVQFVEPTAYDLRSGAPSPADPQPMATAVLVPASPVGAQRRPEICSVLCHGHGSHGTWPAQRGWHRNRSCRSRSPRRPWWFGSRSAGFCETTL